MQKVGKFGHGWYGLNSRPIFTYPLNSCILTYFGPQIAQNWDFSDTCHKVMGNLGYLGYPKQGIFKTWSGVFQPRVSKPPKLGHFRPIFDYIINKTSAYAIVYQCIPKLSLGIKTQTQTVYEIRIFYTNFILILYPYFRHTFTYICILYICKVMVLITII